MNARTAAVVCPAHTCAGIPPECQQRIDARRRRENAAVLCPLSAVSRTRFGGKRPVVLGEFFAADSADVDDALVEDGPAERYPVVEAKTVDPVSISTLGEILGIGSYDDLIDEVSEGPEAESGEAGLFTIPSRMRDALAEPELDATSVAARWGATEELSAWPTEDVETVVRELAALARRAAAESQQIFFWWSL
jgi:hypothetical protein